MDILVEFYKVHYNFGILAGLMVMLALYLLTKRNTQGVAIILVIFVVYNLFLHTRTKHDPLWWDRAVQKIEETNVVDWIWGVSTVNKNKSASEQRLNH